MIFESQSVMGEKSGTERGMSVLVYVGISVWLEIMFLVAKCFAKV